MSASNNNNNNMKMPKFNLNWTYMIVILLLAYMFYTNSGNSNSFQKEVSYSEFQEYVQKGYARNIVVNKGDGNVRMYIQKPYVGEIFGKAAEAGRDPSVIAEFPAVSDVNEFLAAEKDAKHFTGKIEYDANSNFFGSLFLNIIFPVLLILGFWMLIFRRAGGGGGGIFSVGKSRAQLYEKGSKINITFNDVAGQDEAKQEVQEIVKFLKDPKKYTELGGKIPKGALLVGPPGTGKTLLAKAVAGEAGVPFFSLSGSDFVEMFVGVGASRVRDLFRQAKEKSPCIVFIDEIDAVGRARGKNPSMGGNDERESTLNQLLTEMDGFGTNSGIIVMAATNRADILDKALLRAGRFDRQIHVELPGLTERKQIFLVHVKPLKMDATVNLDLLSRQTPGFSGADIANVCNEAALIAARHDKQAVGMQDFLDAIDRIIGGLEKKTKVMTQEEKRSIAIHEAGHATISWFCQYADPLIKVTIVPRGQALGAAWYLPEERVNVTKEQMLDKICSLLGGRAAEELFTGHISTGALNDLERANKMAFSMVAYYGMSDNLYNISYYTAQQDYFQKPYSDITAKQIDEEVKALIAQQYDRAKRLLTEHSEGHGKVAQLLIDNEVIFAEDVENIFGKRQWTSRSDEIIAENERLAQERAEAEEKELDKKEEEQKKEIDKLLPKIKVDS
ncbi:MAG: ATP-dependent zinc metalloprotease FtsH [Bacteroidaceae bacterium]|nr:ATP-dependent zinc metalloprotease FtsH [Bacteroidaceae bacterium]